MKRIATAILVPALLGCAPALPALDFEFGAYVQLPFGNGTTVVGLSARPVPQVEFDQEPMPSGNLHEAGLHLQSGPEKLPVVVFNGVSLYRPQVLNQGDSSETGDGQGVDWHLAASVAIGIGLIAAIANADSGGFSTCSGTECPPPKPEPSEPEAE